MSVLKWCGPFQITDEEASTAAKMWSYPTNAMARRRMMSQRQCCLFFESGALEVILNGFQIVVRRKDGRKIKNHWAVLQDVKNQVYGKGVWAYEVYPPEDMVIDTANAYHLWAFPEPLFDTYTREEARALSKLEG